MTRTNNNYNLRSRDKKTNYIDLSDIESDSYNSDSDYLRFMPVRRRTTRNTCTPKASEKEMGESGVDLIARGGRSRGRGRKTRSLRVMVDSSVDLNAGRRLDHEQAGNTALSAPKAMDTEMVDSGVDLNARPGQGHIQGGNTTLCTARAMENKMVESSVDLITENTALYSARAMETKPVDSAVDLTVGNTTLSTSSAKETDMVRSSVDLKRDSPSLEQVRSCKKTILSWLIDCNLIEEDEQVCYMDGRKKSAPLAGRIARGGILCSCCHRETSVWTFEKHAGSDLGRPYEHIYVPRKGTYLQDCQIAAWQDARERKRRCMFLYVPKETAADQNDDACSICGDGGDLICCDMCPSTYHPSCMNMERVPHSYWLCPYCICKFCGLGGESKEFITCSQCDKKFHWGCFKEFEKEFSKETLDLNCSRLYCGPGCREIYEKLEGSLGIRNDIFASYSWRVIRQMDMTPKVVSAAWNIPLENNSKVAVTCMLMNEAFETITDRHTGINVVQSISYSRGSNLTRINFSRFYTFVLEKDDEIIAAASIRFHGRRIAEMPFIATDAAHRHQGICWALMRVIESFLCNLKVENLIIPSSLRTSGMWMRMYSFNEVSKELEREISSYNIVMFPFALRLYKDLSTSIADGGNDNEDIQTDNQNGLEPEMEQAERPLEPQTGQAERSFLDLNADPPEND